MESKNSSAQMGKCLDVGVDTNDDVHHPGS